MHSLIASLITRHLSGCFADRKNQYLKIQKIHHKALKVVFNRDDGYDELLQMSNEITIHQKHLHALICQVFKSLNNSISEFMWSYFTFKNMT